MKVSYLVVIGAVVLFVLLFVLDYVQNSAPEAKKTDSPHPPVLVQRDSLGPVHEGDLIKSGNSTRDVFKALAADTVKPGYIKP